MVLITGSSGFVGGNLVRYLSGHYSLITPERAELSEPLPAYDTIIHLAGKAHDLKKVSCPEDYYTINFELTKSLFDEFLTSGASKFIFISSVKAVSDQPGKLLDETFPPDPQTHYGKSKRLAEVYILSKSIPKGKSVYVLRPCMIHGPGNKGNLNLLYKFVSKGIPYPLAAFDNRRSFLSVENLCFIIKELLDRKDIASGIYHVADDKPISTNSLIEIISAAAGKKPRLLQINPGLIKFAAKIGDMLHLPLTSERLDKLTESYVVDNSKIRKALGKELKLDVEEGIKRTILAFQ